MLLTEQQPYRAICADPPWKFNDRLPGPTRGAAKNYSVLALAEIENFPLPPIADDALLFLWRCAAMQEEACRVARAWGFKPHSEMVWLKLTTTGKPWFGMGRISRAAHETVLVATRGHYRELVLCHNIRSIFEAAANRKKHSEKPERFYTDIVEKLFPGPYLELFARRQRPGWTCLGHENRMGNRFSGSR